MELLKFLIAILYINSRAFLDIKGMVDIQPSIESNATGPKKVVIDGNAVEQHDIGSQITADLYFKSNAATASPKRGFVTQKIKPGGSV